MVSIIEVKRDIEKSLEKLVGPVSLNVPRDAFHGDLGAPMFQVAKSRNENPVETARDLASRINIAGVESNPVGPYLNFKVEKEVFADQIFKGVRDGNPVGMTEEGDEKIIVEFSSPNYGKPMHVGHMVSTIVGDVVSNLLEHTGNEVYRMTYPGDVGGHMGKMLVAMELWSDELKEADEPTRKMGELYARFGHEGELDPTLEEKASAMVKELEDGNPEAVAIWRLLSRMSKEAFNNTYSRLGIKTFDEIQPASTMTDLGKSLAMKLLQEGIATEYKGAISVAVSEGEGIKLLSADGTAVYGTLDVGAAVDRSERIGFDRMIYVVGKEQEAYFQRLFSVLDNIEVGLGGKCYHLVTGHMTLPEGKISSREGNVVLLDDVVDSAVQASYDFMRARDTDMTDEEIERAAESIGVGALKYFVLATDPRSDMVFNADRVFSLKGKSAPFAQYSYARADSLLEGLTEDMLNDVTHFGDEHRLLLRQMALLPLAVQSSADNLSPQLMTDYAHSLAAQFNSFYTHGPRISELDGAELRANATLVEGFKHVMKESLGLLGINTPRRI